MHDARQAYLETQLQTATPQRLRLMLIEGAIRFAHLTEQHWDEGRDNDAFESLLRCRGIVTELMSAVRPDGAQIARQVMALYVFIFQALTEAQVRRDRVKLAEALRILEVERDTWREVCERMPEALSPADIAARQPKEITASDAAPIPPLSTSGSGSLSGSFSLDA
jgi:flagellar protein FliS